MADGRGWEQEAGLLVFLICVHPPSADQLPVGRFAPPAGPWGDGGTPARAGWRAPTGRREPGPSRTGTPKIGRPKSRQGRSPVFIFLSRIFLSSIFRFLARASEVAPVRAVHFAPEGVGLTRRSSCLSGPARRRRPHRRPGVSRAAQPCPAERSGPAFAVSPRRAVMRGSSLAPLAKKGFTFPGRPLASLPCQTKPGSWWNCAS